MLHEWFETEWPYESTSKSTSEPAKHSALLIAGWKEAELPSQPGVTEKQIFQDVLSKNLQLSGLDTSC